MIKRFFILLLAIVASVGMSYALTPRSGDTWDDNTKTLTVNSNPQDDHYHDQSEIKRLVISSSVTEIGEQAFSSSYILESVIAYDGLQVIDMDAFFSCPKLESVILPSTLREVRSSAFAACDKLKYVTINAPSLQAYGEYAFDDAHENLKIYVPEASLATYKTNWSAYADKFQAIPSSIAVGDTLKVGDAMYSATDVYVDAGYLRFQIKASSLHTISAIAPNGNGKIKVEFTPYAEEFYPSGSYAALTNWIYCYSEYTSGDVTEITVVSGAGTLADPFVIDYVVPAAPAYETVMNLINEIPNPVELTAECKAKIDAARTAYDALSDGDKALVTNYTTLTQAETDYAALAAAAAAPVIAQIEALPTTIKLSTYFSTYDLMVAARAAYNALSAEVQAAVTNLSKLTNLEAAFAAIGGANEKLSKPFSVGEGQVVYFSHGNLQATYNGSNWSWAFAAHQYDYIGDASGNIIINGNGTLSGAGTVDLFGWVANSSTVLTSGVAKYGVSNSDNVIDYGLGETETLKGDWGVAANDANIGGYNDWRILSNDEWVYLFKTRTDAASKYGYATVGGVNGVIIIPDAFTDPMKNKGNKAFIPQNVDKGYSTNVYTTGGNWEAMEAAGAVFMPAAGRRAGTTVTINEGTGFYWSSTPMSYQASYFMGFMGSNVVPDNDRYRYHGLSVRLVSNNAPVASTPLDSALVVKDLIEAIPAEITLEDACVKAINDAREAYNKLSEAAKGLLDEATLAKLTDAETALTALYQVEADKVVAKINAIPTPVELKLATRDSIESARAAYDALNAEQKLLVPAAELQKLTDAEAALAALNPSGGAPLPEGALTGAFSINADGGKIAFSKGNLQATYGGSDWTWAFAAHQYDYIGNAVANTAITGSGTVSANGTVDLFGWSTAATYYGINNTNVSGKHPGDFIDWGETIAEGWRTLTRDEWNYLFETRTDAASKYGHATVAGIHGIIVLPDSYKGTAINADHSDWSNNIISAEDWAAYEANGVAFLPAAGSRLATSVNYVGEYAFYWTSTTYYEKFAYRVRFVPELSPDYGDRVPGQSVRLVTAHTGSPTPLDSAQAVKDLIEAIPTPVTLEDACVNAVQAARDAFNALTEATKGALDEATVNKLNQAITDYTALIQAGADAVTAKIAAIPQPVTLKLATRDSIESARAAYDALTDDQKALVTNYDVLTDAEADLASLNPGGGAPAGALNGKFTINAGGDQIAFAKGNLQATTEDLGANWTWGFAANQWNCLRIVVANSKINGNGTVSENGTVDLFGWSTAATYYGINNSDKAVDYIGDFVDWGPKMGAGWRTLTKDEWNYLIENNTKGRATVNDTTGYIFLPNDWSGPAFTPDPDNFTTNVYSGDDWTAMENAGAVFLPCGPARNRNSALVAMDVKYYSSTSLNKDSSYVFTIYYNQSQSACTGTNRAYGCMVRLVTEGGGATPLDSAQAVKDLIEAIPMPVTLEDACVNAIQAARDAYNALTEATKGALDAATVKKLTDAEAALTALNQAEADKVIAKINAIPQPVELKLSVYDKVLDARAAYDALTADQKLLVTNYQTLLDAEDAFDAIGGGGGLPTGALTGAFSVGKSSAICFSQGNLQATTADLGANWTWSFAANQWDFIGNAVANTAINDNKSVSTNGTVDLFGWSTAETYYGINNNPGAAYYTGDFIDWGTNAISNGGNTANAWHTLAHDEWDYLFNTRTTTSGIRYAKAIVNGIPGIILLPDDWSATYYALSNTNDYEVDFNSNVITTSDWTNSLEANGAVFLPAAGERIGADVDEVGSNGHYWSSTFKTDYNSYCLSFESDYVDASDYINRRQGYSVRLVVAAPVNYIAEAQAALALINAIPDPVTLDEACVKAIKDAREAVTALGENASLIDETDMAKLTDAEADLAALNQAEADKVVAKINNIPTPVELKLATRDSIESARAAYDALTADQKPLVSNYTKLTDAEAALAELNKGGSASVDIVWDINTGIANVDPNTTSPAYEGITITTGNGNRFYQTTTDPNMLRFFFTGSVGSYAFAKEDGSHFTKVVLISSVEMSDWLINPSRIGTDWAVSDENKKATWTGDADTVKIWDGTGATSWADVDSIVFTVNGTATPLDSAQAVKDLIDAIPTPVEYPTSGPAIAAALVAYQQLSDAAKGALDDADVQKMTDAATQYAALDAIAAIEAIPAEIVYDPAVKAAIETARKKYDALIDASKALVSPEVLQKLIDAEQAWAYLVALIEHNVSYIGKDGELKHETVALLHIPDPAPDYNGYEFVRWDVKAGDFLEEGLRIKAVYTPIITTNPVAFDTLVYNGTAQTLIEAGVAKEGHIEYRLNDGEWSTELPKATNAAAYVVYYKLVREAHDDYVADPVNVTIAKAPVAYTAPTAYDTLVYNATNQTLIAAGQTNDGTFEYSFNPTLLDSWNTELLQAMAVGTYNVYYRVKGDLNHLDSTAVDPVAVSIAKAPLTATADDKSIIYGDLAPEFTVTYAGWQGTEGASVLTGEIAYACEYVKGNPVGEYVITPSGVDAANYTITFVNGKLTVNSKSAKSDDITAKQADNEKLVYDAAANKPTIQAKDTTKTLIEDTDYKLTFIGRGDTEYAESATAPVHVGEYTAIVAFIGNYTDTLTVDFVINKAPLTITADDKEVTFGEFAPEFTVSYKGWQGNDTATVLTGDQTYACEYKRGDKIGEYTIIPSGVDAHDYAITFVNGTLTVNRKSAKSADIAAKQADNEKLVYDAEVNRPTIQVKDTTLVLTEAQDYVLTFMGVAADQTPYAESEAAPTHVGNYKAIVAFIGNYIDTLTVDFTINKAPLTITANDTAMIYGDVAPAFTVSYNGWFGNDDESVILGTQAYDCVYAPGSPIGTYAITPKGVEAYDYAITFVDGKLTVNKAHVFVSGAEVHTAKFADGHANAEVINNGILNGIKVSDPIAHITTAAYSSADVAEHLTITLFYELTGDTTLLKNYYLEPTQEVFTTEGVIIEPFIPNDDHQPEEGEQVEVQEGIDVYAYGYCDGSGYSLKYHLNSGNPDQYKINFEDNRFTDIDWTNLTTAGKDGTIEINIPVDLPTGDYSMTVYFRDSRFDWLESQSFTVTFHVNLPETYVRPLFDNVIALIDTCNCLTDIQWYWRANSSDTWQPIPGANGYYYHSDTKLEGEYFVSAKMNGEPTYTCGQSDMETLYGDTKQQQAQVKAYPNPVVNATTVTIENSLERNHNIRIVNLMGVEVLNTTFEGNETSVEMSTYPQGNYMISVDGIVVKVMKQ